MSCPPNVGEIAEEIKEAGSEADSERFGGNVAAEMRALELNSLNCRVSRRLRRRQVFRPRRYAQHATAICDDVFPCLRRAGMEDFCVRQLRRVRQAVNH